MSTEALIAAIAGGVLIGLAAVLLMAAAGRIAGVSGIVARLLPPYSDDQAVARLAFLVGLLLAPLLYAFASGNAVPIDIAASTPVLVAAGLLVGFGAVRGGGCTSGHGVCGIARLSPRSLLATGTFMATGIATVFIVRHVIGG